MNVCVILTCSNKADHHRPLQEAKSMSCLRWKMRKYFVDLFRNLMLGLLRKWKKRKNSRNKKKLAGIESKFEAHNICYVAKLMVSLGTI